MSSIDRITLAELVSEELSRLSHEDVMGIYRDVLAGLSFCLSRMLSCRELIELLRSLVKSLPQIRLSKVISGALPEQVDEDSVIDLRFLTEMSRGLYIFYLTLLFGFVDHELRIPVRFEEDVILGERRYRAFSSRLVKISEAIALQLSGAKIKMLIPAVLAKYVDSLLQARQ
ncbi:MAG: hypothetical protein QXG29_00235 [Sulfolobales archaeon]